MHIQMQHDRVKTKGPGGVNKPLTDPITDGGGGLYVKHILVRREITIKAIKQVGTSALFYLFEVSEGNKILAFDQITKVRVIKRPFDKSEKPPPITVVSITGCVTETINNKTLLVWRIPKGCNAFKDNDTIEILVNVYITANTVDTVRKTMSK